MTAAWLSAAIVPGKPPGGIPITARSRHSPTWTPLPRQPAPTAYPWNRPPSRPRRPPSPWRPQGCCPPS
eukprot:1982068-Pyramimonas_sp.AAC.1